MKATAVFAAATTMACVVLAFPARSEESSSPVPAQSPAGSASAAEPKSPPPPAAVRAAPPEIAPPRDSQEAERPKPPPCKPREAGSGFPSSTGCSGVFGIRGSTTNLNGVHASDGTGLMISAEGEEYVRRGIWTSRGTHRLALGGGGAGFEGALAGAGAVGVRIPIAVDHGPILRAGILGYLRGNDAYYASLLELPQLQVGYQFMRASTVIEIGATSGAVLVGRNRTGEARTRMLGAGFEVGAYGTLQMPWFRLGLTATQLPTNDGLSTPVRVAEGTLCALAAPLAICADARATVTDAIAVPGSPASEVRSVYAGLSVGFTRER